MRLSPWMVAGWLALAALAAPPGSMNAPSAQPVPHEAVDHGPLDRLLGKHVRGQGVAYRELLADDEDLHTLDAYLAHLDAVAVESLAEDDRLALYINLYNASMIREVLRRDLDAWSPDADDFAVFKQPHVRLGGKRMSLDHLEHEIIRKEFKEPRIHAALVCAARSCPPLIARAYRGDDLRPTLEDNMRRFVNDPSRNAIDLGARLLRLSRIFDWFADDFGGADAVASYIDRYVAVDTRGYAVEFIEYDWQLNMAP